LDFSLGSQRFALWLYASKRFLSRFLRGLLFNASKPFSSMGFPYGCKRSSLGLGGQVLFFMAPKP
jgi:hypothetical protein